MLIKAFTPGFFAREDTRTPMIFAGISVALNVTLAITLFPIIAERGIATAEICSGWTNATLLFVTLVRRGHWKIERVAVMRIIKLVIAAALMAAFFHFGVDYIAPWVEPSSALWQQLIALLGFLAVGFIFYLVIAFAIGGADLGALKRGIRRKPKNPA